MMAMTTPATAAFTPPSDERCGHAVQNCAI
jgi:hypothetical protein